MLCPSPASLLGGGKGGAVGSVIPVYPCLSRQVGNKSGTCREPHQREAAAMAGWYTRHQPQRDKGCMRSQTPPPLLKGGEGVRGRDGTLGIQPQRDKGCMRSQTPPPLWGGGRGRGPLNDCEIILGNYFVMYFSSSKNTSPLAYIKEISYLCRRFPFESISKTTRKRLENDTIQ